MGIYHYIDRDDGVRLNLWKYHLIETHSRCEGGAYIPQFTWIDSKTIDWHDADVLGYGWPDGEQILGAIRLFCNGHWVRMFNDASIEDKNGDLDEAVEAAFLLDLPEGVGYAWGDFIRTVDLDDLFPYVGKLVKVLFGNVKVDETRESGGGR